MGCTHSQISKDERSTASSRPSYHVPYSAPRAADLSRAATSVVTQSYGTVPRPMQLQHRLAPPICQTRIFTYKIRWYPDLTVIFRLNGSGNVDAFCLHASSEISTSNDVAQNFTNHKFFDLRKSTGPPRRLYCYSRQSRIHYVVAREIYSLLFTGVTSPETLHGKLCSALLLLHSRCIICRCALGTTRSRPTLCSSILCFREYLTTDLNIRCEDVFFQSSAVSVLLASVQSVSQKNDLNLLPGWPVSRLRNPGDALALIQSLPPLVYPTWSDDMKQLLSRQYASVIESRRAEVLLSWIYTRFRGLLLPATDSYILQGLNGAAQFLVMDAQPETEVNFAKHGRLEPRHILFHGTSMDRLYSVLVQGLQVLSGTPLAQHGARYGSGIYMAREPGVALSYARASIPKTTTPIPHLQGDVSSAKLLLACEHAGNDTSTPSNAPHGMHIIQDPSRVMVRYIFIVPSSIRIPKASELSPAILKNVKHLRDVL